MRVFKRGPVYWFELVFEGKRYQKSTKERNRVKAEGIAAKFRSSLAERRVGIVERPRGSDRKQKPNVTQSLQFSLHPTKAKFPAWTNPQP